MKKRFLITGGAGFIGSNIVKSLVKDGHDVSIIARSKENFRLKEVASKLKIFVCDLRSSSLEDLVLKINPEYIFHLAAYGMPAEEDNIHEMIDVNLKGLVNLINTAKKVPLKLFINTGSCLEYGIKTNPMKETDSLEPINDYAVIKSAGTLYCQKEAVKNNFPAITLRLFTPYGYFEDKFRLIPSIITQAIVNEPIKVSTPTSVRDFVFIEDVVEAYLRALSLPLKYGEIFNVGSGRQHNIGEVVNLCLKISKSSSEVIWGAVKKQTRYIEPTMLKADMTKTKEAFNWKPKTSLAMGLKKTIEWFKINNELYS